MTAFSNEDNGQACVYLQCRCPAQPRWQTTFPRSLLLWCHRRRSCQLCRAAGAAAVPGAGAAEPWPSEACLLSQPELICARARSCCRHSRAGWLLSLGSWEMLDVTCRRREELASSREMAPSQQIRSVSLCSGCGRTRYNSPWFSEREGGQVYLRGAGGTSVSPRMPHSSVFRSSKSEFHCASRGFSNLRLASVSCHASAAGGRDFQDEIFASGTEGLQSLTQCSCD